MSNDPEMVKVRIVFSTTARFDQEVTMRKDTFERINQEIEDEEDVDLTEWIDWMEPISVDECSDVDTFEIVETAAE